VRCFAAAGAAVATVVYLTVAALRSGNAGPTVATISTRGDAVRSLASPTAIGSDL